ncbi:MAG: hypothetical protein K6E34_01185 [Lachnospiraceae bacterium]|nr:hypothetical protein [Lachnospiraceae bacterium]
MNINKRLNDIIIKYDLDEVYPYFRDYLRAQELIDELIVSWKGKKIICICNSQNCRYYIENRIMDDDYEVDFEIIHFAEPGFNPDSEAGKAFKKIREGNYDEIYVAGYNGSSLIGHYLRLLGLGYHTLYDHFALNGLYLDREWYDLLHDNRGYESHESNQRLYTQRNPEILEFFDISQRYRHTEKNDKLSGIYLKKLIFISLFIHDFVEFFKYINEYICLIGDEAFQNAKQDVEELLKDISDCLAERKRRDIIIHWVDKVPYKDLKDADYLYNEVRENSVFFTQMYTMCPYTGPTFIQMFGEGKPVDDGSWGEWFGGGRGIKGWKVIKDIDDAGYSFMSFDRNFRSFPKSFIPREPIDAYAAASDQMWTVLSYILESEKPMVMYVHLCLETHDPFWFPDMDDELMENRDKRYHQGIKAVDRQLRFYSSLYNDELIRIYMSDHGKEDYQSRFHCFFSIASKEYPVKKVDSLLCWLDFGTIMSSLLRGKPILFDKLGREYVELQDLNWISGEPQMIAVREKAPITWFLMGFRGALTKDHIYLKFNTGNEWFQKNDEYANVFEPGWFQREDDVISCSDELLKTFRDRAGETDPEIVKRYDKYNKYLQIIFKKAYPENIRKIKLLNELFESFGDETVSLRMGGPHSCGLYSVLTPENRKRIRYIVDPDPECCCKTLGIPIIPAPAEGGVLVLSSLKHRDFLLKEAEGYGKGIRPVDPYSYLEEKGISCRFDCYCFEPAVEDYEVGFPMEAFASYE